jgi:hypothetical protein
VLSNTRSFHTFFNYNVYQFTTRIFPSSRYCYPHTTCNLPCDLQGDLQGNFNRDLHGNVHCDRQYQHFLHIYNTHNV